MEELLQIYSRNDLEILEIEKQITFAIGDLQNKQKELQEKNEEIKEKIKLAMEEKELKKYESDYITITYIAPITKNIVDSAKLKEKYNDIYNDCLKISNVKSSIRIKIKDYKFDEKNNVKNSEINLLD